MPELTVQFTKRADGEVVLRCVRADGSATWQRHPAKQALFFALHDLTHYAVETELGFRAGFYGLLAAGWDINDTGGKSARGPLPPEAVIVENIVGLLSVEGTSRRDWTAAEFNEQAEAFANTRGLPRPRQLTDAELARVRTRIQNLFAQWAEVETSATLELLFDRAVD